MAVAHVEGSKNEAKYDFNGVLENERQEIDERKKESERKRERIKNESLFAMTEKKSIKLSKFGFTLLNFPWRSFME